MTLAINVRADALRDPSVIPTYLRAFHRYLAGKNMSVELIRLPAFLGHHDRCEYPAFSGWDSECLFWGIFHDGELIATWAAKPYVLLPGETLREMMEGRGLYFGDETWRLSGKAATLADRVTELAVFEGGLCMPREYWQSMVAELIVREMPLYARVSAVDFWRAPWVWYLAKKPTLAKRFGPEDLGGAVEWTKGGALKDDTTRFLGVSSAPWIAERARDWPARPQK